MAEGVGDIVLRFTEMFAPPSSEDAVHEQQRLSEAQQLERRERIQMAASAVSKAPGTPLALNNVFDARFASSLAGLPNSHPGHSLFPAGSALLSAASCCPAADSLFS